MDAMELRAYQSEAIECIQRGWAAFQKQLLVAPTGSGKTIIFSHLAKCHLPGRSLILCHREELLNQAIDKLRKAVGIRAELEKAELSASLEAEVVVASVQTMIRRLDRWPVDHFRLVIADEAHHATSDSWQAVLGHFGGARILGATATPSRMDKRELGAYFEAIAAEISMVDLIRQGYLCPITVKTVPLRLDISEVRRTAGDYNEADLGAAIEPMLDKIAAVLESECRFRRTVVFLPLIQTSLKFMRACRAVGIDARHVDGTTPNRAAIISEFAQGRFDILSNAAVLTEGWDDVGVDCVVMLRPTESWALYTQCVGRGMRPALGKRDLLLLDFLWQSGRHNLIRPAALIEGNDELVADMTAAIEEEEDTVDLLEVQRDVKARREASLRRELESKARKDSVKVDAMDFCLSFGHPDIAEYQPVMQWEFEPVTPKQANVISNAGLDLQTVRCKGHASKILGLIFHRRALRLATFKQVRLLTRLGHPTPHTISFQDARSFLDERFRGRKAA